MQDVGIILRKIYHDKYKMYPPKESKERGARNVYYAKDQDLLDKACWAYKEKVALS